MNWKKILGIVAILAVVAILIVRLKGNKEIAQQKIYQHNEAKAITVQVDTIRMSELNDANTYSGTFEPEKETKISAEVQGKINKILVDVGSTGHKGQSLVQLDHSLLKLQLQALNVQLEGLQADVNRYTILSKADAIQGVQLEKAMLGWKSAKIQRATLLEQINKTTVKAPFNGIVTFKFSEEGAFAAPGMPLLQITDIRNLKFTVNVPETDLSQFQLHQTYAISVDTQPDLKLFGKVIMTGSKANMSNSFPVQFRVANANNLSVKSGMFGKIHAKNSQAAQAIVIPAAALNQVDGKTQVYLVKNGQAVLQTITVGKNIGDKITVVSGLKPGDMLITSGFINLSENANVIVK